MRIGGVTVTRGSRPFGAAFFGSTFCPFFETLRPPSGLRTPKVPEPLGAPVPAPAQGALPLYEGVKSLRSRMREAWGVTSDTRVMN